MRVALTWLIVSTAVPVFAQTAGSLRGTVTDPSGAVVPGAAVVLTNESTTFSRQVVSDGKGSYFVATVEPGDYTLQVRRAGFKTREIRGVHVSPNDTRGVDLVLEVGDQTEEIKVTTGREIISTQTGAREGLITSEQIDNLSTIGRNPMELMRILPGVVAPDQSTMEVAGKFNGASSTSSTTVNGIRGANMMVTLDGAKLQDIGANNGTMIVPNNEMVSEVKIQTSNYAAEFGDAGVHVQAVTKGGGAQFHAGLYDSGRNQGLTANDRSRVQVGQKKPKSSFQFPGAYVSGPLLIPGTDFNRSRDKLFFFVAVEFGRQWVDQGSSYSIVPTLGQRQGLFNDYVGGMNLNQATTVNIPSGFPNAGTPAPNNDLRPYLTPDGQRLLNLWPLPNYSDPYNRYNYFNGELAEANRDEEVVRIDYNVSEATRVFVRLARDRDSGTRPLGLWWNSSDIELPTPVRATGLGRTFSANVTSVLSPTATNEVIFSWSQLKNHNGWDDPAKMELATYGIRDFRNPLGASPYAPQMVMQSNGGSLWSANDVGDIFSYNSFYTLGDNFTKVTRSHALKAGVVAERWNKRQNLNNAANVQLNFDNNAPGSTGVGFGDVLVGRFTSATVGTPSAPANFVSWSLEAYAQDSWKVTKRLTLEYGLRFAKWTNNEETNGLGAIFEPARYDPSQGLFLDAAHTRANGLAYARTGDVSKALTATRPLLWMPRLNLAWDVSGNGRTLIRGGAGLFYNREQGNAQYGVANLPPNAYSATLNASSFTGLADGQGLTYSTLGLADPFSSLNSFSVSSVKPDSLDWPLTLSTSLSVARRILWHQVLEVGYVGTFGRHLAEQQNFNVIQPGTLLSGIIGNSDLTIPANRAALETSAVNAERPFPALQNVVYFVESGVSNYHSLQATLSRSSGRFQYLLAYTFSKSLGTLGGDQGLVDPIDPRNRSYGVLGSDRSHIANFSWSWQLGNPAKTRRLGRWVLNGWRLSGISTFMSGAPIRLGFTGDIQANGMAQSWWGTPDYTNAIMPVYTCDPRKPQADASGRFLDIGCIAIPALGQSGPFVQPYYLRAPDQSFHDLTALKEVRVGKGDKKVQLRIGMFNVFNQASPAGGQDLDVTLNTTCNVRLNGLPNGIGGTRNNVCDPSRGFSFTPQTLQSFGRVVTQRGHRVVSLGVKLFF